MLRSASGFSAMPLGILVQNRQLVEELCRMKPVRVPNKMSERTIQNTHEDHAQLLLPHHEPSSI